MADAYQIRLTSNAARDLESIFNYIRRDSPQNAARVITRLLDAIDSLDRLPHRYKVVRNAQLTGEELRSMPVRPYLIRYHVDEVRRAVTILAVRHGARLNES